MKIISHRGKINKSFNDENNENAINNFMKSQTQILEIDIQLTKDDQIILFHNERIFNKEIINKNSGYLIKKYNLILLTQVLDIVQGKKSIYLDIKKKDIDNKKLNLFFKELFRILDNYITTYNCDRKSIYICSFYKKYTEYILYNKCAKEYEIGIILDKDNINYFLENFYISFNSFDFISIDYNILDNISFCFGKIPIFCYTINEIIIYKNITNKKYISGLITDNPEYFISELNRNN